MHGFSILVCSFLPVSTLNTKEARKFTGCTVNLASTTELDLVKEIKRRKKETLVKRTSEMYQNIEVKRFSMQIPK